MEQHQYSLTSALFEIRNIERQYGKGSQEYQHALQRFASSWRHIQSQRQPEEFLS